MKTILAITTLSLLTTAAGCNKKDEPSKGQGSAAGKVTGAPPAKSKDTGPFASWDLDARRAAFQGALITDGKAWNVQGDKVTVWDGKAEQTFGFEVVSPCEVKVTETSADGTSSSSTTSHYTLKDGAIVMGLGDAGSRRGAEAVACVSNQALVLDAQGTCTAVEYDDFMNKWKTEPATCGFAKDGDKEVFKATVNGMDHVLVVDGDTLWSEQLASTHSQKAADFAAAKAAVAK
jgi:hypothetical protein